MRQPAREKGVDVVTALARPRIVREYEALAEGASVHPGVIVSSSLAAISLLEDKKATLLARLSGVALTTVIVRGGVLCGYRCTELPATAATLRPRCCWKRFIPWLRIIRILGAKASVRCVLPVWARGWRILCPRWSPSFHCKVSSLLHGAVSDGRLPHDARPLADREADGLVGWMMHRN